MPETTKKTEVKEAVNHPAHYGGANNIYEAIKVIEAWGLGFCLGNTVKYICRSGRKGNAIEDLRKARWYLDHEIERREKESEESDETDAWPFLPENPQKAK